MAEGASVTIKVTLNADPERTVTIPLTATNQNGASTSDYAPLQASVVFNSGDTEKTFSFTATADNIDDDDEKVKLSFGELPARVANGDTKDSIVSITDDDDPPITVQFGAGSYSVDKSDDTGTSNVTENEVAITVTLSADPERTVTIPLSKTDQGGATSADYSGVPTDVSFDAGETSKTFTFTATADTVDDDGESAKIGFGTLPTGVAEGTTEETAVSITDDDHPEVQVNFAAATYTVPEGGTVKVTLSASPERAVTIPLTKTEQGGAVAADYSVPTTVQFGASETEKEITFTAVQDTVDDGESVKLEFGTLPTSMAEGATFETVISIIDEDHPASVSVNFDSATYAAAEGATVTVELTMSQAPERSVTIPLDQDGPGRSIV